MMTSFKKKDMSRIFSPWLVTGGVFILFVIVAVLTIMTINRQRAATSKVLLEKGQALIRALEAGSRIGMRGWFSQGIQLSHLLEETARLPGVAYIVVTDKHGAVIASNDFSQIGESFSSGTDNGPSVFSGSDTPRWYMEKGEDGGSLFIVWSEFNPVVDARMRGHARKMRELFLHSCPGRQEPSDGHHEGIRPPGKMFISLALVATALEDAQRGAILHSIFISCIILLVGLAGFVSLFWAQSLRISQRLLSDSKAFASEVVTNLPEGLVMVDPKGEISFQNEFAAALWKSMTGVTGAGMKNDNVLPSELQPVVQRLDTDRVVTEQEMVCSFEKNRPIPLGVSGARIITEDGRFLGKILILRDLREVRRLQQEIKRREKLAAIGSLAAGLAHEIRNPLSSVKGFATLFQTRFDPESEEHEAARIMVSEVDRLNRVVTELLEYARPSNVTVRKTDIGQLVEHSLSLIRHDLDRAEVRVETDIPKDMKQVFIDPDRMQQCLLNIYLNAVQSMDRGGALRVQVFQTEDGRTGLRISDSGKGIPREDLSKIFDPYYTTKNQGTGLGLAMVLKIIEAHDGEIEVTSREGQGTVFTILLPETQKGTRNSGEE